MDNNRLLEVNDLRISFSYNESDIEIIRGINLHVNKNEIIGILGESGSGKTVTASSLMGLTRFDGGRVAGGEIIYNGSDITKLKEKELRMIRGKEISFIFQDPVSTLNPYRKIGRQIEEVQRIHGDRISKKVIIELLEEMGLDNASLIYNMYPSQISGGQCQRVSIAMSLIGKAKIIIADEPTSSVDASMQGIVLDLFKGINRKYGVSIIVITHNFEVAKEICSRIVIMYGGLIMEQGTAALVIENPLHPYTKELISCARSMSNNDKIIYTLEGRSPTPSEFKNECPFIYRCKNKTDSCAKGIPDIKKLDGGREIRCMNVNR